MKPPCMTCENKGCGAYHDQCEAYQKYHAKKVEDYRRKKKEAMMGFPYRKSNGETPKNSPVKCHKK